VAVELSANAGLFRVPESNYDHVGDEGTVSAAPGPELPSAGRMMAP